MQTPLNSCPVKMLPSPFGSATPSSSASEVSTPARTSSTPSGLMYPLGQSETFPRAAARLTLRSSPMTGAGLIAHPSSTPADPVTLTSTGTFGTPLSDVSDLDGGSRVPSTEAAEQSSASEMADLGVVRPGSQRPSTLPVHSPQVPFGVQATREDPTPFDSMPRCVSTVSIVGVFIFAYGMKWVLFAYGIKWAHVFRLSLPRRRHISLLLYHSLYLFHRVMA